MTLNQISVFLENKPGKMQLLTQVLADHHVDMRALSLAETTDFGIVRIIVDDAYAASTLLKDAGFIHSITKVLGVAIPDQPGGLHTVLTALSGAEINVEYMYAFFSSKIANHACMIFHVQDAKAAVAALAAKGISCITQEDLMKM